MIGLTGEASKYEIRALDESEVSGVIACENELVDSLNDILRYEDEIVIEKGLHSLTSI